MPIPNPKKIQDNFNTVKNQIIDAERRASRDNNSCKLVAISKTFSKEYITPLLDNGHRIFGENRIQESLHKWPKLKETYDNCELHLVGPLQTNKTKEAINLFDVIETLDRIKLANSLIKEADKLGKMPKLLIQVNTGSEPQKAGILPDDVDSFIEKSMNDLKLPIVGLMCIPPFHENPAPHFALLHKIAKRHGLKELSMGMSADFEMAIELGATYVRVGSAIFGARTPSKPIE